MSIIIAKIENNKCIFLSDTRVSINNGDDSVTGNGKLRLAPNQGVLKIHIPKPRVCIAFAGEVEEARLIIYDFIIYKPTTIQDVLNFFHSEIIRKNVNVEFIVGIIDNENIPHLFKINSFEILKENAFWIGEKSAYSEFQSYFHNGDNSSILDNSKESFRKLINNSNIDTIGDFIISCNFNENYNSFIYEDRAEIFGGFKVQTIKAGEVSKLKEGNVNEGAFSVSNFISKNLLKQAVCLFFSKGKVAYLYLSINENNSNILPIIIYGDINHVINEVSKKYQIDLTGFYVEQGRFNII